MRETLEADPEPHRRRHLFQQIKQEYPRLEVVHLRERENRTDALSIVIRVVALFVMVVFVVLFFAFSKPAAPPAEAQSTQMTAQQTVIGKDCQQCHRVIVASFALDTHGKSAKFLHDSRAAKCEVCHSNSEKHAESSTKTTSRGDEVIQASGQERKPMNPACNATRWIAPTLAGRVESTTEVI